MDLQYVSLALALVISGLIFLGSFLAIRKVDRFPFMPDLTPRERRQMLTYLGVTMAGVIAVSGAIGVWAIRAG